MPRPHSVTRLLITTLFTVTTVLAYRQSLIIPPLSTQEPFSIPPTLNDICFAANPDIAGIGVRVSAYAQTFVLVIVTSVSLVDGYLDPREGKLLRRFCTNLLITACALLVSSFIQASTSKMSLYHALIVLDWSWMLTTNALAVLFPIIDRPIERLSWYNWTLSFWPSRTDQIPATLLVSLHMSLMGMFGLYVWSDHAMLGTPADCSRATILHLFFTSVSAANRKLRIVSLMCYTIVAIPIVNVVVVNMLTLVLVEFISMWSCYPYTFRRIYRIAAFIQSIMNTFLVVNMELTIRRNRTLVGDGEWDFDFGQILPIILIILPAFEALRLIARKLKVGSWEFYKRLARESDESWKYTHRRACDTLNSLHTHLKQNNSLRAQDTQGRKAIINALASAHACLNAADTAICRPPPIDLAQSDPQSSENPPQNPGEELNSLPGPRETKESDQLQDRCTDVILWGSTSLDDMRTEVVWLEALIFQMQVMRISEIQDSTMAHVVKAYLKAASDSLSTASAVFDVVASHTR